MKPHSVGARKRLVEARDSVRAKEWHEKNLHRHDGVSMTVLINSMTMPLSYRSYGIVPNDTCDLDFF